MRPGTYHVPQSLNKQPWPRAARFGAYRRHNNAPNTHIRIASTGGRPSTRGNTPRTHSNGPTADTGRMVAVAMHGGGGDDRDGADEIGRDGGSDAAGQGA